MSWDQIRNLSGILGIIQKKKLERFSLVVFLSSVIRYITRSISNRCKFHDYNEYQQHEICNFNLSLLR